jgi:hypothetical protein
MKNLLLRKKESSRKRGGEDRERHAGFRDKARFSSLSEKAGNRILLPNHSYPVDLQRSKVFLLLFEEGPF